MKKFLALNFGRANGNCKKFLNFAVEEAKKAAEGKDIEFEVVDCMKLKITHCIGCGACSRKLQNGKDQISCIQKDDFEMLSDKVLEADAILVAAPVYVLGPTGQLKNFVDRFGPAHDKAYMLFENELRKDTDGNPLNENCLKRHLVSYISIGGAVTPHWVSFGMSGLNLFGMSINMKVVDQLNAYGSYSPDRIPMLTEESTRMGRRLIEALDLKNSEITWESEPGICPVCHCSDMTLNGTTTVCCPVCGIYGKIRVDGDKLSVDFSEEEKMRSRLNLAGVLEHQVELGRKPRYPKFDEYLAKFKAEVDEL